jgi:hypothetical protein
LQNAMHSFGHVHVGVGRGDALELCDSQMKLPESLPFVKRRGPLRSKTGETTSHKHFNSRLS